MRSKPRVAKSRLVLVFITRQVSHGAQHVVVVAMRRTQHVIGLEVVKPALKVFVLSGGVAVFKEENPYLNEYGGFDVETTRLVNATDPSRRPRFGEQVGAITVGGTMFASYLAPNDDILAHERVHALQFDFVTATLGDHVDTWTMERARSLDRWLKLNLVPMAFGAFNQAVVSLSNHDTVPWEREAILLSGHR